LHHVLLERLWVVERAHASFNRLRRLPIRYERRPDMYEAFMSLVILNQIKGFC